MHFSLVWKKMPCCLVILQCQYWGVYISLTYWSCISCHAWLKSVLKTLIPLQNVFTRLSPPTLISVVNFQITMSFLEDLLEWFFSAGNEWFWLGARQVLSQICWTSNIPPRLRWPMGKSNNCEISSEWVVPLVVSRASQLAGCWTSFQSYNRKKERERFESLISLPLPIIIIITALSV